jgi:hypothetical protein
VDAELLPGGAQLDASGALHAVWRTSEGRIETARLNAEGELFGIQIVAMASATAPVLAVSGIHRVIAWQGAGGTPMLYHSNSGVNSANGRIAEDTSIRLDISSRGAALAQWTPAGSAFGGAYWTPKRRQWTGTASAWGEGFLRSRSALFADPEAEVLRKRIGIPAGELRADGTELQVVHADDRGDVLALLTAPGAGSFAILRRHEGERTAWRPAAVAGIGGARPVVAGNRRGDLVAAFLSPSEFADGDLNSAIASFTPTFRIAGASVVKRRQRISLRLSVPETGALRLRVTTPSGRVLTSRRIGIRRGTRLVRITMPPTAGRYHVRAALRASDGRGYSARRGIRVR